MVILGIFITLALVGTAESNIRYASIYRSRKQIDKVRYLLSMNFKFLLFSSVLLGILMYLFSGYMAEIFNNEKLTIYLKIFSLLIPVSVLSTMYLNFLRSYEKIREYSFVLNILQNFVKLVILVCVIFLGIKVTINVG